MKKLIFLLVMCALLLTACGQQQEGTEKKNPNLNGMGINELVNIDIPQGFTAEGDVTSLDGAVIQKRWTNDDKTEIGISILVYDGTPIMVDPRTIEEFTEGENVEKKDINGNTFHIVNHGYDGRTEYTAYTEHGKYILSFTLEGADRFTSELNGMFYELLEAVSFNEVDDD